MTIWIPSLERRTGPRYLRIAAALRQDIAEGRLTPGTRLPTHRDLAEALGVTVGTVSRAYAEAARQQLVRGEIGRGTYVRGVSRRDEAVLAAREPNDAVIDLSLVRPVVDAELVGLAEAMAEIAREPQASRLLDYPPTAGLPEHRRIAAGWLRRRGLPADEDRLVVTAGGHNGIGVVLASLTQPGDVVLTEQLTYPGIKGIAKVLHLRLAPVAMDADGLVPEALEAAAVSRGARILYTMPTLHNPTTTTQSAQRREEVAAMARRLDLKVIEDDVMGLLVPGAPPPLARLAPERCYGIHAPSKFLAPGLRIGFVLTPEGCAPRVAAGVRAFTLMASPLLAELTCRWLADGTAERVLAAQLALARSRQQLARRILAGSEIQAQPTGFHLWLQVPEPWQTEDFVAQARDQGVQVSPASAFAVGRTAPPHAVRVGLGGPRAPGAVEQGLNLLADILRRPPGPVFNIV